MNAQVILLQSGDTEYRQPQTRGGTGLAGTTSVEPRPLPDSFYTDMSWLVESLVMNGSVTANHGYRRLCFFLGKIPTPQGEEEFETWMSQATLAVEEWSVPEAVKRQRPSESLRGPEVEVINNL